ncbi:hypothetical protein [Granulosicoccus antarcticus]|uniref:Uncharacterized protein n=1 Tax=Granulosicoccus antarcticus IMCC3135 TaxID=1192854 RepID=A0A2Z2NUE7_9GAMM|nr:hypothetical protein [Granulosicoccus antarcticus]ASJ75126.1 hypothetical protein IMCC3135_25315 [Granulosicoccus antarcticus IMCC3135]
MNTETFETLGTIALSENSAKTVVSMMMNIIETACEHEPDLGMMRLVNFMDLYRTYLEHVIGSPVLDQNLVKLGGKPVLQRGEPGLTDCATFEQFVSDSRLLHMAAVIASRECGIDVATPPPLKHSANTAIRCPISS